MKYQNFSIKEQLEADSIINFVFKSKSTLNDLDADAGLIT